MEAGDPGERRRGVKIGFKLAARRITRMLETPEAEGHRTVLTKLRNIFIARAAKVRP